MTSTMRPVLRTLLAALLLTALCTAHALTLPEALSRVAGRSSVENARSERRDARINLERVARDPFAVRADTLQAEQRLALAEASLEQRYYAAVSEVTNAYTGVLQASEQTALAEQGLALSRRALEITTIRLENGSATQLDMNDARVSFERAQNSARAAREGRDLALNNLFSIVGGDLETSDLGGVPSAFFTELPPLSAVLESVKGHPELLSVQQQAELAALGVAVLDPLYAAQTQIDTAESQLVNARSALREAQRSFRLRARNLHSQAENARETLRLEVAALGNAQKRLQTRRQRLEGGLISQLVFEQAVVETAQARVEAGSARAGYLGALLKLQAGSLVPLGGPFTAFGER